MTSAQDLRLVTTLRVGGDLRGVVSVGGDRAVGGGVTLTKEEKQTWKKRTKKQGPCGNKKIKPLKKFNTTFSWKIAGVTSGGQNFKGSKLQKRKRKKTKGKKLIITMVIMIIIIRKAKRERNKMFELHFNSITTPWADFTVMSAQL